MLPDEDILLLIGVYVPHAFWTLEERRGNVGEPFAVRTLLGWSLGPVLPSAGKTLAVHHVTTADEVLEHNVKRLWQLDAIPPPNPSGVSMSKVRSICPLGDKQSKSKVNSHYQISLPWRSHGDALLKNNRQLAKTRLNHLQKRLGKDRYLKAKYTKAVNRYLSKGHARLVSDKDTEAVWFLPHHPVTHPFKPGKVRVVFDCAAKLRGTSLNDMLLSGPDLLQNLIGVLLRFRLGKIAFTLDIQVMFHHVKVLLADQKFLCFLWWPQGDTTKEIGRAHV